MTQLSSSHRKFALDKTLLFLLLIFIAISLVAIYCAEPIMSAYLRNSNLWMKQLQWYLIGATVCVGLMFFGMDRLFTGAKIFYWILMGLLLLLLVDKYLVNLPLIKPVNGTTAWYQIPYIGSFQPSEFMKIVLIIMCASIISEHNELKQEMSFASDFELFFKIGKVALPPLALIYFQPDTGIPIIIVISILVMLCVSGIRQEWFFIGLAAIVLIFGGLILLYKIDPSLLSKMFGGGYKFNRIYGWLDAELYSGTHGHQLYTSLLTMGSSGLTGSGLREAVIYFPEPQTDFIFTVIGQNFGLLGTGFVVLVCLLFDLKLSFIAMKYNGERERLLVCGLLGMLLFQQVQNMGMIVGLLPITGITLPFISYGGSSMLSYMIPLAIVFTMSSENKVKFLH